MLGRVEGLLGSIYKKKKKKLEFGLGATRVETCHIQPKLNLLVFFFFNRVWDGRIN